MKEEVVNAELEDEEVVKTELEDEEVVKTELEDEEVLLCEEIWGPTTLALIPEFK